MIPLACASLLIALPELHSASTSAETQAAIASDRILTALVEVNGVPGMGAAVWQDGELVWSGSAGYADAEARRPVDADTVFRLASVSKLLAATAAGRLQQEGRLDVDASVRSRLTWLPDRWPTLTSRQIAAHISGLPHYQIMDMGRGGHRYASVREAVGIFQDRDLLTPPGQKYQYSSWGYTLLSAVVEESAGRPYLDYVRETITPGLRIGPDQTDSGDLDASTAYDYADGVLVRAAPHDLSYTWGGGGMAATAPDLARWGGRVLSGEVVQPETLAWMTTPARLDTGAEVDEGAYKVGFGWRVASDRDGRRLFHHAGVTVGARSALLLYPDQATSVSVLSNAPWVSAIEQTGQMLAAPFTPAPGDAAFVACPVATTAYDGSYGGEPLNGAARFALEDGLCVGQLSLDGGTLLAKWLNEFPQKDAASLPVISVTPDHGLSRAALVTPTGAYDLRSLGEGRYEARFGGALNRTLELTLR